MFSSVARVGLPLVAVAGLAVLTSCGGDAGGASASTVQIRPSSYSVKEPATTTTVPTSAVAGEDGKSAAEQSYVVQSDSDVPFNIAKKFEISLDDLRNYNGWSADYSEFPGRGGTVRIPPGAKFIDPNAATTTTAAGGGSSDTVVATPGSTPEGAEGDRCSPTYEVQSGDAPLVITRKFDITIEQLNAANVDTPNWPNLYTGREIKLPAPADCTVTADQAAGATTTTTAG